jgi:hypothetical protein
MVDAHGQMVGPPIMKGAALPDVRTPIVGPKPGNTPLPQTAVLKPTDNLSAPDQQYGRIRDEYQAPFGSNARDISPAPIVSRGPSPTQIAGAQSVLNNIPPTERERFNAATDVAGKQADAAAQGRTTYNIGAGRGLGITSTTRPTDRINFWKSLGTERVDMGKDANGKPVTRRLSFDEKLKLMDKFFQGDESPTGGNGASAGSAPQKRVTDARPRIQYNGHWYRANADGSGELDE